MSVYDIIWTTEEDYVADNLKKKNQDFERA